MRLHLMVKPPAPRALVRGCFLALAVVCLGLYGYDYVQRAVFQTQESREFDRTMERAALVASASASTMDGRYGPPARRALIGRLSVPRLHLSAMVREGIDGKTLKLAVGHIPGMALPGQAGNVGVAGHRDTFFRGLKDLAAGDEIRFSTVDGNFTYNVGSLLVVDPENAESLAPSAQNVLTMVTCYPFYYVGAAPKRFVVRAGQVSPRTSPASNVE